LNFQSYSSPPFFLAMGISWRRFLYFDSITIRYKLFYWSRHFALCQGQTPCFYCQAFPPENEEISALPPCGLLIGIYIFYESWSTETFRKKEATLRLRGLSLDSVRDGLRDAELAEPKASALLRPDLRPMGSGLTLSGALLLHLQRWRLTPPERVKEVGCL
jgi:hypothetical protein